jgi:hypothetical protein
MPSSVERHEEVFSMSSVPYKARNFIPLSAIHANSLAHAARLVGMVLILGTLPATADAACGNGNGAGADFKNCIDDIIEEQERSINLLEHMTEQMGASGLLTVQQASAASDQLGFIRSSHGRGRMEKDDATDDEFDDLMVKGTPSECEFRLLPRYAMGPPPRPVCDDTQIAANQCEEVCEFSENEKMRNAMRGVRLEDSLAQALQQTQMANDEMEEGMAQMAALAAVGVAQAEDSCGFVNPHPNFAPFPPASILAHNELEVVQETISAIAEDACQQDAAGFNTSTACIVITILEGAQKALTAFVNSIDGNYTSAKVDATFDCVSQLKSASNEQAEDIEQIQQDISTMQSSIDDIITLLNTPAGRRSEFPDG